MFRDRLPENNLKDYTVFRNCEVAPRLSGNELGQFYENNPEDTFSVEELLEKLMPGYAVISGMDKESANHFRNKLNELSKDEYIVVAPETSFDSRDSNTLSHPIRICFWNNYIDLNEFFIKKFFKNTFPIADFMESLKYLPSCIFIFDLCAGEVDDIRAAGESIVKFCDQFIEGESKHKFIILLEKRWYLKLDSGNQFYGRPDNGVSPQKFIKKCSASYWNYQHKISDSVKIKHYDILNFHAAFSRNQERHSSGEIRSREQSLVPRDWLNEQVMGKIRNNSIVLLKGGPGAGKSTFMAHFAAQTTEDSFVCAVGFNGRTGDTNIDHLREYIIQQMCDSLGWDIEAVAPCKDEDMKQMIHAASEYLRSGGFLYAKDGDTWSIAKSKRQFVICIDGLDEASDKDGQTLAKCIKVMATPNTRIIASGRPNVIDSTNECLDNNGLAASVIDLSNEEFRENVNDDINQMLQNAGFNDFSQRRIILRRCKGLFLLACLLSRYLDEKGWDADAISLEPDVIYDKIYGYFWKQRCLENLSDKEREVASVVFGLSNGAIPQEVFTNLSKRFGIDNDRVLRQLLQNNLIIYTGNGYTTFHESLHQWLHKKYCKINNLSFITTVAYVADLCKKWYEYDKDTPLEQYALANAMTFISIAEDLKGLSYFLVPTSNLAKEEIEEICTMKGLAFLARRLSKSRCLFDTKKDVEHWIKRCEGEDRYNELAQLLKWSQKGVCAEGAGPIHIACEMGYMHIVEFLLSLESQVVNQLDNDGSTPLFYAAGGVHLPLLRSS